MLLVVQVLITEVNFFSSKELHKPSLLSTLLQTDLGMGSVIK